MHHKTWQLQEAKARFSEVVNQALTEGPQTVTRRGHVAVVVVAADEFRRTDAGSTPGEFFRRGPYLDDVVFDRQRSLPREVVLCDS